MASYVTITLDTTAPAGSSVSFDAGAYINTQLAALTIATTDSPTTGYQMKLWGNVDKTYDTNVQSQESNIANPTAAPTLAASAGSSGLAAGTYYVTYTWYDGDGETLESPEASVAITLNQNIDVTMPTFPSGTGIQARVYISATTTTETLQGSTATTSFQQSTSLVAGAQPPASNNLTGSAWVAYATAQTIKLLTVDGNKTVNLKIRDDVLNTAAAVSDVVALDTTLPVVTVMSGPDVTKISKIATKDTSVFTWQCDSIYDEYKVKAVAVSGDVHTAGTLIPTTAGSLNTSGAAGNYPAITNVSTTIKGTDLQTAVTTDGAKVIKVFVMDDAGNWST